MPKDGEGHEARTTRTTRQVLTALRLQKSNKTKMMKMMTIQKRKMRKMRTKTQRAALDRESTMRGCTCVLSEVLAMKKWAKQSETRTPNPRQTE